MTFFAAPGIAAVLFDKDGTLFDFGATWNAWSMTMLQELSAGDPDLTWALAESIGFDLNAGMYRPDSPAIAGTNAEIAKALCRILTDVAPADLEETMVESASRAPLSEAVPLVPLLAELTARGLALGVMTNDHEQSARAHLSTAGVVQMFDFVAGADSGFGAKPDPDPLLAFCDRVGVHPAQAVMVGDSQHDLIAGRAAGMVTVGVLTGPAEAWELAPLAEVVLPDIGHLPLWLSDRGLAPGL